MMEEHEYKLGFHEGMSIRIKISRERVLGVSFQEKLFNGVVSWNWKIFTTYPVIFSLFLTRDVFISQFFMLQPSIHNHHYNGCPLYLVNVVTSWLLVLSNFFRSLPVAVVFSGLSLSVSASFNFDKNWSNGRKDYNLNVHIPQNKGLFRISRKGGVVLFGKSLRKVPVKNA